MKSISKYVDCFLELDNYLRVNNYKGYEFDDLLASPFLSLISFNNLYLKRIYIQIGKKFPLNIRPLLGVNKLESTKARGFIAKAYLNFYLFTQDIKWLKEAEIQLQWLIENCSKGYIGKSWGNHFDFASRGGFFQKNIPTVVWTAHIAESFDLAFRITKKKYYSEVVIDSAEFIYKNLEILKDETGVCLSYAPGVLNLIHNSNLLGAITLLRGWKLSKKQEYFDLSKKSFQWSIARINQDGSWFYGATENYKWVDNFHTAYNLDCLLSCNEIVADEFFHYNVIKKTYSYWINNFFQNNVCKYYNHKMYPIDIQCCSQAIESLSKHSNRFENAIDISIKVADWTIENMRKKNGSFRYQKKRFWNNNLESIHWGQATMLSALSNLVNQL